MKRFIWIKIFNFVIAYGNIKALQFEANYNSINNAREGRFYENKFKMGTERTFSEQTHF